MGYMLVEDEVDECRVECLLEVRASAPGRRAEGNRGKYQRNSHTRYILQVRF